MVSMYVVDLVVCGQLEDAGHKLAGMAIAFQIIFVLDATAAGLTIGSSVLVSRARGGGNHERQREVVDQAGRLMFAWAAIVSITGVVFARPLLAMFEPDPIVLASARVYFQTIVAGAVFTYLGFVYSGVCTSLLDRKTPLWCGAIGSVVNLALTYTLGLGRFGLPAMGVGGIALGTLVAQMITTVLLGLAIRRKQLPISLSPFALVGARIREIVRIGIPGGSDMLMLSGHAVINVAMLGALSTASVAAHGIGMRVQMLVNLPAICIAIVTSALVGGALGAGNAARAKEIARTALVLGVGSMCIVAAVLVAAAGPIIGLFGVSPGGPVEAHATDWVRIVGVGSIPIAIHLARSSALSGSGATGTSLRISVASVVFQLPVGWWLAFQMELGPIAIWISLLAAYIVRAVLAELIYRRGRWAVPGVKI